MGALAIDRLELDARAYVAIRLRKVVGVDDEAMLCLRNGDAVVFYHLVVDRLVEVQRDCS